MCCGAPALPGQEESLLMLFLLFLHRRFRREKRRPHRSGPSFLLWNPRGRSPLVEPPLPVPFPRRPTPYVGFAVAPSPQGGTFTAESPLADRRCRFAVAPARCPLSVDHHRLVRLRRIPTHTTKKSPPPAVRAWPSPKPKPRGRAWRLRLRLSLRLCLVDEASPSANPKTKILGG
jgi:hypothetical protein